MQNQDKIIFIFYIILGVIFVSTILYVDTTFDKSYLPDILPKEITEVTIQRTIPINPENLFLTFTDVENYPLILPKNVLNVKIINQTQNQKIIDSTVMEKGIKINLLLKQIVEPYKTHSIEVLSGDAKGTTIKQFFTGNSTHTELQTTVNFKLKGILSSFLFIPQSNIVHALNTVIDEVVYYTTIITIKEQKIVDDLYRETLFRPADPEGLHRFSSMLKQDMITVDELRNQLLASDEAKNLLKPHEIKNIEELNLETKSTVTKLYEDILNRLPDPTGLQYFGSLLEIEKISEAQLKQALLDSEEHRNIEKSVIKYNVKKEFGIAPFNSEYSLLLSTEIRKLEDLHPETISIISSLYEQYLDRKVEPYSLQFFGSLLENGKISEEQLNQYFFQYVTNP